MNAKKKGNAGEHKFAHFLVGHGFGGRRNSMSGGGIWKGDVSGGAMGMCFEVKTVKKINLMECWRQVERDSGMSKEVPVLAVHFDGMPDGKWLVVMESSDWIEYIKQALAKPKTPAQRTDLAIQLREIADELSTA